MKTKESWTVALARIVLLVGFVIGMGYCLYLFSANALTSRESTLLGIVLTICSIMVSWLVTHIYSSSQTAQAIEDVQERNQANLRTYALKASEKVNNLSNELQRLSLYLEQELTYTDHDSTIDALRAREERIESAIHIIRTLKSVNDTSLSDWEGVIGDELDEQREEQRRKEQELAEVISRVEAVIEHQRQDIIGSQESTETLRSELRNLKQDLRAALVELNGTRLPTRISQKPKKHAVEATCLQCFSKLSYTQRPSKSSVKSVTCTKCEAKLLSRYDADKGFVLEIRANRNENISCPKCNVSCVVSLDNVPGASVSSICKSCGTLFRVARNQTTLVIREAPKIQSQATGTEPSEELIALVRSKIPAQPWEQGIHKRIADLLGLNSGTVSKVIAELIKRGDFYPQIDGTIYYPAHKENTSDKTDSNEHIGDESVKPYD